VRLLDRFGNIAPPTKALRVKIGKTWVDFAAGDAGWKRVAGPRLTTAGVARLTATAPGAKGAVRSNPILVTDDEPETRWLWGDMQGHSARSDGEGTPEAYFDFAAGPGALDFAALTDHEWQLTRDDWRALQGLCAGRERAGEFVPLLAWEYSPGGHRIVYYPDCAATPDIPPGGPKRMWQVEYNDEPLVSWSRDAAGRPLLDYGDFHDIYRQLAGSGALAIPHTTSSWEMGNDWDAHVAAMTPLVEIYSAHGSSEADDSPRMLYDYLSSGSVRTALERGDRLGFIGSSDCHDGKPGRTLWGPWPGGLTALGAPRLDRASIWTSLRERRVYATTGARILLAFTAAGASMGQTAVVGQAPEIRFEVHGTDAIQRVEIVSRGQVIRSFSPAGTDFSGVFRDDAFPGYAYYYLRVTQRDGAMAWASPVWVFSPGVPRVERFSAQPADGRVRLRWDGGPGPAAGWYEVWRRRGNDGGGRVERYQRLAAIPPNPGVNVFADANPPPRGIAAYYLLRWMRADGPPLTIGLVAAEQLAEVTATVRGFVIPYFVEEPGAATIVIRDLNRTEMRRFEQRHDAPGAFEIAWDGRDAHGQPCRGLHFYEVSSGGITTPRRPIRLPN
jgi:hypothetical protein